MQAILDDDFADVLEIKNPFDVPRFRTTGKPYDVVGFLTRDFARGQKAVEAQFPRWLARKKHEHELAMEEFRKGHRCWFRQWWMSSKMVTIRRARNYCRCKPCGDATPSSDRLPHEVEFIPSWLIAYINSTGKDYQIDGHECSELASASDMHLNQRWDIMQDVGESLLEDQKFVKLNLGVPSLRSPHELIHHPSPRPKAEPAAEAAGGKKGGAPPPAPAPQG